MRSILWVAAGGACGAVLRFAVQEIANTSNSLPWGTFLVNATGSFAVGLLVGLFAGTPWFEGDRANSLGGWPSGRVHDLLGVLG